MQAKPDFISVKVLTFIFIKCGFLFILKYSFIILEHLSPKIPVKIKHIIYILEEKLPMIMERRL